MAERVDDATIRDEDALWRRLLPGWIHLSATGDVLISSVAFKDRRSGELSVHLAALADQRRVLAFRPGDGLAELLARIPRSVGCPIVRDPDPDDPSHALICSSRTHGKLRVAKEMAKSARLLVKPEGNSV